MSSSHCCRMALTGLIPTPSYCNNGQMPHPCIHPGIARAAGCGCRPDKQPQWSGPAKSRQRWPHSRAAAFTDKLLKHKAGAAGWLPAHAARDKPRLASGMCHPIVVFSFLPSRSLAMGCVRSLGRGPCPSTPVQLLVFLRLRPSTAPHPLAILSLPPGQTQRLEDAESN